MLLVFNFHRRQSRHRPHDTQVIFLLRDALLDPQYGNGHALFRVVSPFIHSFIHWPLHDYFAKLNWSIFVFVLGAKSSCFWHYQRFNSFEKMKSLQVKEPILLPKEVARSRIQSSLAATSRSQLEQSHVILCGRITLSVTMKTPSQKITAQTSK